MLKKEVPQRLLGAERVRDNRESVIVMVIVVVFWLLISTVMP